MTDDDLLSAYLDDELDAAERSRVEAILSGDDEHRAELDSLAEVRELVRGLAPPEPPVGWIDSLTAAIAAAGDEPVVADLEQQRRRRAPRVTAWVAASAAAAALLLAVVVPTAGGTHPALASDVRVHQAGSAAAGDPVSGLAPLAAPLGLGR